MSFINLFLILFAFRNKLANKIIYRFATLGCIIKYSYWNQCCLETRRILFCRPQMIILMCTGACDVIRIDISMFLAQQKTTFCLNLIFFKNKGIGSRTDRKPKEKNSSLRMIILSSYVLLACINQ